MKHNLELKTDAVRKIAGESKDVNDAFLRLCAAGYDPERCMPEPKETGRASPYPEDRTKEEEDAEKIFTLYFAD